MIATETIYQSLFELLQDPSLAGVFVTTTRRLKLVEDVDENQMPYLGQLQLDRLPEIDVLGGTLGWVCNAEWYLYVSAPNEDVPSTPILNPIVDKLLNLFPQEGGSALGFTTGGKVCTLTHGAVEFYEGLLGQKAVVKIPIKVRVPN